MDCLVPSLNRIPRGRWFCPTCEASGLISDYLTQRPRFVYKTQNMRRSRNSAAYTRAQEIICISLSARAQYFQTALTSALNL